MQITKLDFEVPAIRVSQRAAEGKTIFFAKLKAEDFATRADERFKIDHYRRVSGLKDEGYQREESDRAVEKIKNFVIRESPHPILPTAIIMNSRVPLDFKQENSFGYGKLIINAPLYIIDGQHRYKAWKSMMEIPEYREKYGDYEFPVIILSGFDQLREIEQFYVINSRQKKIKIDLAQRHLLRFKTNPSTENLVEEKDLWKLHALKIVDYLNEELNGIWKGKIGLPSDPADLKKSRIINQSSFVSSLSPFFVGKDKLLEFPKVKIEESAEFLSKFWAIVAKIYSIPAQFPNDYSLMKTVGVFSLHIFLAEIARDYDLKKDEAVILQKATGKLLSVSEKNIQYTFWKSKAPEAQRNAGKAAGAFSSAAGHARLAAILFGFAEI